jgi:hypothetical protein
MQPGVPLTTPVLFAFRATQTRTLWRLHRLFKDGMREVEAEQFFEDFRSRGREDILAAGTGVA